jgi:hypothetical protein
MFSEPKNDVNLAHNQKELRLAETVRFLTAIFFICKIIPEVFQIFYVTNKATFLIFTIKGRKEFWPYDKRVDVYQL